MICIIILIIVLSFLGHVKKGKRKNMLRIHEKSHITIMSDENQPCIHAKSGDRIVFETADALGGKAKEYFDRGVHNSQYNHLANPSTGPVYVKGAASGDTLEIIIEKILLKNSGFIFRRGKIFGRFGNNQFDYVDFKETDSRLSYNGHLIPIEPMIGVIGTAPLKPVSCRIPGDHGGNMDTRLIKAGAHVYLPVFVDGGLLAIGDIHACMGDGEVSGQGIEFGAEVTVKIKVIKGHRIRRPQIENNEKIVFIASASSLDEAKNIVLEDVGDHLMNSMGLSFENAFGLAVFFGNLRISQIVNPLLTVRYELEKSKLPYFSSENV
jgi:amidase